MRLDLMFIMSVRSWLCRVICRATQAPLTDHWVECLCQFQKISGWWCIYILKASCSVEVLYFPLRARQSTLHIFHCFLLLLVGDCGFVFLVCNILGVKMESCELELGGSWDSKATCHLLLYPVTVCIWVFWLLHLTPLPQEHCFLYFTSPGLVFHAM